MVCLGLRDKDGVGGWGRLTGEPPGRKSSGAAEFGALRRM